MAERIVNGYKRLFEVRLLHHYWLDEGTTVFDLLPDDDRNKRLLTYDMRSFLSVTPTASTDRRLKGLRCVFKTTALGFVVAAPGDVQIPDNDVFDFVLTVQSAGFFNYTALTWSKQNIYELFHQPENKVYRYKENVPVFSNLTGVSRGVSPDKSLYLSKEIPALSAADKVESLIKSGNALLQLTGDEPGAATQQLSAQADDLPVFVHQADSPAITPPAGLSGAPPRGIELSGETPDDVFALIRITAVNAGDPDYSCTSGGLAKDTCPVFQIRFKNRSTFWKYYDKRAPGNPPSTEPNALPLTFFGNAGTMQKSKPSAGFVKAEFDTVVKTKVNKLISEIFE